jgi:murein L,D-transpeptidase YcbB/YkuD
VDGRPGQEETPATVAAAVRAAFERAAGAPRLVGEGGPAAAGERLEAALERLEDHGIDPRPYRRDELAALRARLPDGTAAQELDRLLVRAFFLLAEDLRAPERADAAALQDRLVVARGEAAAMGRTLQGWLPPWPQYAALVAAHRRYRALAAAEVAAADGPLPAARDLPQPGARHATVAALRRRLAREGFHPPLPAPDDSGAAPEPDADADLGLDVYDGPLREAVGHFQYTHALEATGSLDRATLAAIAVPLERRARTIAVALGRLRDSAARGQRTFLRVNVPQYVAELWVDDRLVKTLRVIVGDDGLVTDPVRRRTGHLNRTPLLASAIDRVVLNPVWRVPARIRDAELLPLSRRDPELWERDGYLLRGDSVVQLPGPRNALGRVKFLFENDADVYLHDTPAKHLFRRPRRAFSHGCVRLQHPLPLARWLLDREDHPRRGEWDALLAAGREVELTLTRPLPIVIEYVSVAVDGEGRTHFFPDVYGLDAAALER